MGFGVKPQAKVADNYSPSWASANQTALPLKIPRWILRASPARTSASPAAAPLSLLGQGQNENFRISSTHIVFLQDSFEGLGWAEIGQWPGRRVSWSQARGQDKKETCSSWTLMSLLNLKGN